MASTVSTMCCLARCSFFDVTDPRRDVQLSMAEVRHSRCPYLRLGIRPLEPMMFQVFKCHQLRKARSRSCYIAVANMMSWLFFDLFHVFICSIWPFSQNWIFGESLPQSLSLSGYEPTEVGGEVMEGELLYIRALAQLKRICTQPTGVIFEYCWP